MFGSDGEEVTFVDTGVKIDSRAVSDATLRPCTNKQLVWAVPTTSGRWKRKWCSI